MDFGTLLQAANQNSSSRNGANYYKTKFEPPKKEAKTKTLSTNIQKFLARKEEEERKKAEETKKKREELLAMRDPKAKNKIKKMLKVIKSANKSVLEEAVDNNNTAVTMQGPDQPDEDDYGYVSQEASAFYSKMMEKYKNIPEEEKFSSKRGGAFNPDLSSTKDRVRAAILRQQEEELLPHKRKRKSHNGEDGPSKVYSESFNDDIEKKESKPKSKRPMPPPLDFNELLKIAEKKQFEPVIIEPKKRETTEEQERLMTKKQKKEYEEYKAYQEARLKRDKERTTAISGKSETFKNKSESSTKQGSSVNPRIPKLSEKSSSKIPDKRSNSIERSHGSNNRQENTQMMNNKNLSTKKIISDEKYKSSSSNSKIAPNKIDKESRESFDNSQKGLRQTAFNNTQPKKDGIYHSPFVKEKCQNIDSSKKKMEKKVTIENQNSKLNYVKNDKEEKSSPSLNKNANFNTKIAAQSNNSKPYKNEINGYDIQKKQVPMKSVGNQIQKTKQPSSNGIHQNKDVINRIQQSRESRKGEVNHHSNAKQDKLSELQRNRQFSPYIPQKTKQIPPNDLQKPKQFSSNDVQKPRQFPPSDVQKTRQFPPSDVRKSQFPMSRESDLKKQKLKKRRIMDDDSEYDSSLEDFIDDGPEEGGDVSQYIKEIFGYDKSRYRDNEDDVDNMESNYTQVMKEEYISKKIGLMEDLEDMKMEALEKKKKQMGKKRKCD